MIVRSQTSHIPPRSTVDLSPSYVFTDAARDTLRSAMLALRSHPYREQPAFRDEVAALVDTGAVPADFRRECEAAGRRDEVARPFHVVTNCPIDLELPVFDAEDPVGDKHRKKQTFVAEAYLQLYAVLTGKPPVSYKNVNDGDVFQDIFPKKSLYNSQSQKTLVSIGFHKDLANHFVRPDYVNILGLRSDPRNEIFTTFVRTCDLVEHLGEERVAILTEPAFYTPYDDLSVYGDKQRKLGDADKHAVINGRYDFRYFEGRTIAFTEAGKEALRVLDEALALYKGRMFMRPGDFVSIANNSSLHGKDVGAIADPEQQKIRWSIKTVNVSRLEDHARHYLAGRPGVVDG